MVDFYKKKKIRKLYIHSLNHTTCFILNTNDIFILQKRNLVFLLHENGSTLGHTFNKHQL